jgi:ABC-type multidrug transport system permease subunit
VEYIYSGRGCLMEWFNKHLNWTYGLMVIFSYAVLLVLVLAGIMADSLVLSVLGYIIVIILNIASGVWILRKKGQPLWFLVLVLFYLAFVVLAFALPNKKSGQGEMKKISDAEYYDKRES